jgi:hypothetical protein
MFDQKLNLNSLYIIISYPERLGYFGLYEHRPEIHYGRTCLNSLEFTTSQDRLAVPYVLVGLRLTR